MDGLDAIILMVSQISMSKVIWPIPVYQSTSLALLMALFTALFTSCYTMGRGHSTYFKNFVQR